MRADVTMRIRNTTALAGLALTLGLTATLVGCSPLPPGDIPLEPSAPWACDGVARDSIDKIIGEGYTLVQFGDWTTLKDESFLCEANGIHGHVQVEVFDLGENAADEGAAQLNAWYNDDGEVLPNPHGVPGTGYRTGTPGDFVTAGWVCGNRKVEVRLITVWVDDQRNQLADAANLLQQVLPYVCANEAVPGVDYSPDSDDDGA